MEGKICTDICLRKFTFPRCEQFSESKGQGKLLASRNDNFQGQINEYSFAANGGYCVYYPSNFIVGKNVFDQLTIYCM